MMVLWDYRGHGRSPYPKKLDNFSMEMNARDIKTILDHLGAKKAFLIGHSMGVQVILEFYHQYPKMVYGLVPLLGTYGHPANTFFNWSGSIHLFKLGRFLTEHIPDLSMKVWSGVLKSPVAFPVARMVVIHRTLCKYEDMVPYLEHLSQLDLRVFFKMATAMQEHTAEHYLKDIKVPVLIIAGEKDLFTPLWLSYKMQKMIPGSEMLVVPEGSHAALIEQPELINLRIEKFLYTHFPELLCKNKRDEKQRRTATDAG